MNWSESIRENDKRYHLVDRKVVKNMSVAEKEILKGIKEYAPAKSRESIKRKYGIEHLIKLAGNENRLGCSPKAKEAIRAYVDDEEQIFLYPDGNVTVLRELAAKKHDIKENQLIFGNGSFELIEIIAKTYLEEGDETIYSVPSFNWYENVTKQAGAVPVKIPAKDFETDIEAILQAVNEKTKIIWLCNPNNPTGTLLKPEVLQDFVARIPSNVLLVLDEAYLDFVTEDYPDSAELIKKYDNVIALKTFSKLYGLAGFRIGYGYADQKIITSLLKSKTPINVSSLAQVAATASIRDEEFRQKVIENNRKGLELYYKTLDELGLKYVKSAANFILFETGIDSAVVTEEYLKHGILVRGGAEYGYPEWIRVTVGTESDNQKVLDILRELVNKGGGSNA